MNINNEILKAFVLCPSVFLPKQLIIFDVSSIINNYKLLIKHISHH